MKTTEREQLIYTLNELVKKMSNEQLYQLLDDGAKIIALEMLKANG